MALTDITTSVASGIKPVRQNGDVINKKKNGRKEVQTKRRLTNRSITCCEELHNRIKKMSEATEIPMQRIIERFLRDGLEKSGY